MPRGRNLIVPPNYIGGAITQLRKLFLLGMREADYWRQRKTSEILTSDKIVLNAHKVNPLPKSQSRPKPTPKPKP